MQCARFAALQALIRAQLFLAANAADNARVKIGRWSY